MTGLVRPLRNFLIPCGSLIGLVVGWAVLSALVASPLLPTPFQTLRVIETNFDNGDLVFHTGATLLRVGASFALALSIGTVLGLVMGLKKSADRWMDPLLVLLLNLPALVVILLSYMWLGLGETAAIAAVAINKIPTVTTTVREGARSLDRNLMDMAKSFRLSRFKTLRYVICPQLFPYVMASARTGLALIWKIVLVVELLGRSNGVGFQLHLYFQMFDVAGILAYSLTFIAIVLIIELIVLKPLDRIANAWRT